MSFTGSYTEALIQGNRSAISVKLSRTVPYLLTLLLGLPPCKQGLLKLTSFDFSDIFFLRLGALKESSDIKREERRCKFNSA